MTASAALCIKNGVCKKDSGQQKPKLLKCVSIWIGHGGENGR